MIRNTTEKSSIHLKNIDLQQKEKMQGKNSKKIENKSPDRLSQLQEQIQKGEYKIDLKKTSEKMALNLLNLQ